MATFIRPNRTNSALLRLAVAAVILPSLASLSLSGQAAPQGQRPADAGRPLADFRHFPGGKSVPGLDVRTQSVAGPLAAEANRELPPGVRVQPGARPVVSVIGTNQLYRFALEYEGVPFAAETDYVAVLHSTGRVLASRTRNLPETVDGTQPTTDASTAWSFAAADARQTFGIAGQLTVANPRLEIWVDAQAGGRLIWGLTVRSDAPLARSIGFRIAAVGVPEVLEARENRYEGTLHAQGNVWQTSPLLPTLSVPFSDVRLSSGATTDVNGDATVPAGLLLAALRGPFADVFNNAGPELAKSIEATAGHDILEFGGATELELAQTTAFYWTTRANRWVRQHVPSLDGAGTALDGVRVFVNQSNLECNGFSDGFSFTLGSAGAGCLNMATATVIVHEFGHVLHAALDPGFFNVALSEGFGDALSALVTGDSCLARDAIGSGSCFRDATEVTLYPAPFPDVHDQGRPFAQFAWALALNLGIDTAAQLILGAIAAAPADIPDAVHLSFVVDDDDGTLATCSPNQRALEQAADSRTLPRPATCADVATTLTSVTPTSPASSNTPTFRGTTAPSVPVGLFTTVGCTGSALKAGTADAAGTFAIPLTVGNNSTTTVYAKALPTDGRIGGCSNGITYVHRPPSVTIADASNFEGKAGVLTTLTFGVSLTDAATGPVTVSFTTSNGTAVSTNDYQARTGSVTFAAGEKSKAITVTVVGDGVVEKDETIAIRISATGAPLLRSAAQGTIRNDDNVGVATLSPSGSVARSGDVVPFEFGWVVPATKPDGTATNNHWRDLTTMRFRLVDPGGRGAFEVVWIQETNTFQTSSRAGAFGMPFAPGLGGDVQETPFFALDPVAVVVRTAPGPAATLVLPLRVKQAAIGKTFRIEGAATDDFGDDQPFEVLGSLTVVP
jgi:hypothetical protein